MDKLSPERRSWNMGRIRGKNTEPEMRVRRVLYRLNYRYRLHEKDLPGKPDIVIPRSKTAIFVHGCFWHRHIGCKNATMPSTRRDFWAEKLTQNTDRDNRNRAELQCLGWKVIVIWECQTENEESLEKHLIEQLVEARQ